MATPSWSKLEQALALLLLTAAGLTPAELEIYRRSPSWPVRVAAVHTIPRELRDQRVRDGPGGASA